MKRIFNWSQFLEAKSDKLLTPLLVSDKFLDKLKSIDSNISNELLSIIDSKNPIYDNTCISFDEKNDEISFINTSRISRTLNTFLYNVNMNLSEFFTSSGRSNLKIGRFIKKILPLSKDSDIEVFVNKWKASFTQNDNFKIVSGKELVFWYKEQNYEKGNGTLNKSCMRSATFLELYQKNNDVVSMIILLNTDNKLIGRALLWKLTTPKDKLFMDRIYTVNDSDEEKFKSYAKEHGYIYKKSQTYGEGFVGVSGSIETTIKSGLYSKYPYMDTLFVYDKDNGILTSNNENEDDESYIRMRETNGLAYGIDGWDDWNDCECDPACLLYCENIDGYCSEDDAVYLDYIEEWYAPNDDAFYDVYASKYYKIEDRTKYKGKEVYTGNIKDVIINDNGDKKEMHINDGAIKIGDIYYLKSLCYHIASGRYGLLKNSITIYLRKDLPRPVGKVSLSNNYWGFNCSFLTKEDSIKYNKPIIETQSVVCDLDFYNSIKWVGMEDSLDIPADIKKQIRKEISEQIIDSSYYKYDIYKEFHSKDIKSVLLSTKSKLIDYLLSLYDFKSKLDNGLLNFEISEGDIELFNKKYSKIKPFNIIVKDMVYHINMSLEQYKELLTKCYLESNEVSLSYRNFSSYIEKKFDIEISYEAITNDIFGQDYENTPIGKELDRIVNYKDLIDYDFIKPE